MRQQFRVEPHDTMGHVDDRALLGIVTPSSNTRLEPLTFRMLVGLPEVSPHFSRFRVVDVGLHAVRQFDIAPVLESARLLADAHVDAIVWSGTSGAWRGLDADRALCAAITDETGVPATTSTLALLRAVELASAHSLGLVTPYPDDMHAKVASTLSDAGATVTASRNHAITASNWELSLIGSDVLSQLVGDVAAEKPDAITTFCTNLAAADLVPRWEAAYGIPVFDSVSLAVWGVLQLAGIDTKRVEGWGALFNLSC